MKKKKIEDKILNFLFITLGIIILLIVLWAIHYSG